MIKFKDYIRSIVNDTLNRASVFVKNAADRHNIDISIRLYEDKGVQTTVRRLAKNKYRIYMPMGVFYRFSLLSYIVRFSSELPSVSIILSPTDRRELPFFLPARLKVIFDPSVTIDDIIIGDLISEYCDVPLDVTWIHSIHDAVLILLKHELGHICEGHLEFMELLKRSGSGFDESTLGLSEFDVRQGFEVAADQFSAMYLTSSLIGKADAYKKLGIPFENIAFEFSLNIGILVTLFDCRSRSLDVSSYEYHPHPLIRFTILNYAISESLLRDNEMISEAAQYWRMARKTAMAVANRVGGLYCSEMHKEGNSKNGEVVPICPLKFDQSPVNESVLIDFLTRASERGRRLTIRINQHKEFKFHGLAGLRSEFCSSDQARWNHIFTRLVASRSIRDKMHSGVRFSTFYGPVKE